jgi:hypothetical protein
MVNKFDMKDKECEDLKNEIKMLRKKLYPKENP